jgi:fucose permease
MNVFSPAADTASPRDRLVRSLAYYWLFVCLGSDAGIIGPSLPSLARQTGTSVETMGLLFLLGAGGATLGTILSGRLFGRLSGHRVMGIAQWGAAVFLALVPFVPWFWVLCVVFVLKGICAGVFATGGNTLLVWTHREKATAYLNGLHFCFGLGAFLAPLVIAQVLGVEGGYRLAFWFLASFMALAGLRVFALAGRPAAGVEKRADVAQTPEQHRDSVRRTRAVLISAALYLFFYVGAEISFGGWIFTYTVAMGIAPVVTAAYLNSGFWLLFTIGRLVSVGAAVRLRPERIIPISLVGCLAAAALLLVLPASRTALWATTLGLGFFMAPLWPMGYALAGRTVHLSAARSSAILVGDTVGGMLLPSATGFIIRATSPRAMVWLVGGGMVLNAMAYVAMRFRRLLPRP